MTEVSDIDSAKSARMISLSGVTGLALSIVALVTIVPIIFMILSWDDPNASVDGPYVMIYSWSGITLLGLIASICSMVMAAKKKGNNGTPVAALVMSILAVCIGLLFIGLFFFL